MSPFDAARYARLLEGLEVTVLHLSKVGDVDNPTLRFDSSFFQKEFLRLERYPNEIGALSMVRSGTTPADRDDNLTNGVVLLKTVDIQNRPLSSVDADQCYKISHDIAKRMAKTRLLPGDVLINIVGATNEVVGRVALVPQNFPEANITQAMALIRSTDSRLQPELVFCFLASRFGQAQIRRLARPTGQFNMNLPEVESIRVPNFHQDFCNRIKQIIEASHNQRDGSRSQLVGAELRLSQALGITGWKAPEPLSYIRQSSDAFASGRLDAQHFQPRFRALTNFITATGQGALLADWLNENKRGKQPDYVEDGLPVVNSKHVLRGEVRLDGGNRNASFANNDLLIRHGDVLINGTGVGTIGRAAPYLRVDPAIPDNHVTILRPKQGLDAVYLSVFLNSMAGQWQVEERLRGSSGQIELYPADIAQFTVWIAPPSVQIEIRRLVEKGHEQKQRANQLLDAAKRAVEIAIEDGEADALAYLDQTALPEH
jgi:type I restriction enzyme S subunit